MSANLLAGLALGIWVGAKVLSKKSANLQKNPQQLSKISVLGSTPGSSNATPRESHESRIRTRIDTYDGIQQSLVSTRSSTIMHGIFVPGGNNADVLWDILMLTQGHVRAERGVALIHLV